MAEVLVSVRRLAAGDLPHLCARTARPTEDVARFTVADGALSLSGWLPLSRAARLRMRLVEAGSPAVVALAAVLWTLYIRTPRPVVGVLALVAGAVAAGTVWARGRVRVTGRLEPDGTAVRLCHVHPRFAAAVARTRHAAGH